MGELVPIVGEGFVEGAVAFYEQNQGWIDPAIQWGIDKVKDYAMDEKTMEELRTRVNKRVKHAYKEMEFYRGRGRQKQIRGRKRKNPKKNNGQMTAPIASVPNTIKCMDLGKYHVRGRKSMRVGNGQQWKTYKFSYQDSFTPAAGQVGWYTTVSSYDNNNTSTKNTLNTGRYAGFNGVDKLCQIDQAGAIGTLQITAPIYSATADVRSVMTDAKNINTCVVLRRQVVQMNWQNADAAKTAEVTCYLVECKKDMYEWRSKTANQRVAEDYIGYGFLQKYDAGSTGEPASGIAQPSLFTLNDNPRFQEYFKIVNKTRTCLQPGQSCRKSFIMNGNQGLSYKHLAKNIADWNDVGPVAAYYHIAHKKGEKFFIFKVHGTMEPTAGGALKPGYTSANVVTWWETTWQATYIDLITQSEYIHRVSNF